MEQAAGKKRTEWATVPTHHACAPKSIPEQTAPAA
jgi:hypothetical protein